MYIVWSPWEGSKHSRTFWTQTLIISLGKCIWKNVFWMNIIINCLFFIKAHFYDLQDNASSYFTICILKPGEMPHLPLKSERTGMPVIFKWVLLLHFLYIYSTENWAMRLENHCCFLFHRPINLTNLHSETCMSGAPHWSSILNKSGMLHEKIGDGNHSLVTQSQNQSLTLEFLSYLLYSLKGHGPIKIFE